MKIIYKITNKISRKVYIGQSKKSLAWKKSKYLSSSAKDHIALCLKAEGKENFEWKVIKEFENISQDELDDLERFYIKKYRSTDKRFGYNLDSGGGKGKKLSPETRKKMSDAHRGEKRSPETRKKIGDALRGEKLSPETRKKIGDAHRGKKCSPETRKKMSESRKLYCKKLKGEL